MKKFFSPDGILAKTLDPYEARPQQLRMAEAVSETLSGGGTLVVEAGTGTGKTLAYLIPAILSGKKVVVSTGTKNLQEQIFHKDIAFLREQLGLRFKAALLKGKNNYLCLYRFRQFSINPLFPLREEAAAYSRIQRWAEETATGDRAELADLPEDLAVWREISVGEGCLGSKCPDYNPCHITRLRQEAAAADLIVVNHHLFFADLALKEVGYGEVLPHYHAVIFDEAHKIEETATRHFGLSASTYRLEELVRDAHRELKGAAGSAGGKGLPETSLHDGENRLAGLTRAAVAFFSSLNQAGPRTSRELTPEEAQRKWNPEKRTPEQEEAFEHLLEALTALNRNLQTAELLTEGTAAIVRRAQEIRGDLETLFRTSRPDWVTWIETRGKGVFLQTSPLDLSDSLRELLVNQIPALVFTSATLSVNRSADYFKSRIGLAGAQELLLDSPFDFPSQTLLYLPRRPPDPNTPPFVDFLAQEIQAILDATEGRAFVLFTSYRNLEQVYARCRETLKFPLLRQGDRPRSALLREFQENIPSVLFATGSFWEGVDVPGESLSCVIIDRLPFASPKDPLVEARIDYLKHEGGDPFYDYQVPEAVLSLRQGVGRLIRSRSDRGVVAILDGRLRTKGYGKLFLNSLPTCRTTEKIEEIRGFFRGKQVAWYDGVGDRRL